MEAVEAFTRENVSLMTKLRDAININAEMANKINIKPTQDPEEKKLADKAKRKVAFEKNLDLDGHCYTHGFRFKKRHSIQTCLAPAAGHQRAETIKISWGAERMGNDTMGLIWHTLN